MARGWNPIFYVLALLLLLPSAMADAQVSASVQFSYRLGASALGSIEGVCDAKLADLGPGGPHVIRVGPEPATLRLVEIWANYTLLASETGAPIKVPLEAAQEDQLVTLPAGDVRLAVNSQGVAMAYAHGSQGGLDELPRLHFATTQLAASSAIEHPNAHPIWQAREGALEENLGRAPGWSREVSVPAGRLELAGKMDLYLEATRIEAGPLVYQLPEAHLTDQMSLPGLVLVHELHRYAWLEFPQATLALEAPLGRLLCHDLAANVRGNLTAYDAQGTFLLGGTTSSFSRRELSLGGAFAWEEHLPEPATATDAAPVEGRAQGTFDSLELDFAPVGTRTPLVAPLVGLGVGLAALLGFLGFLYTARGRDQLLSCKERRLIFEAILSRPGLGLAELLEHVSTSATNARYHVHLLSRNGLVHVLKVQGRHRYVAARQDPVAAQRKIVLQEDPKLASLLSLLEPDGTQASQLVERLREHWGLSRAGGWKVLQRALRLRLVSKWSRGRRVTIRASR